MTRPEDDPSDFYQLLAVAPNATSVDIARAYRRQARAAHPDSHPADPAAPARFRALASAYRVLSDPAARAAYDHSIGPGAPRPGASPAAGMPPAFPARPAAASVPGATLRAGPVRIDPPAAAQAPAAPEARARSAALAVLLAWRTASRRERSW